MNSNFSLILFSTAPPFIREAVASGVAGILVDWESAGKESRQASFDTQINHDTLEDLRRVRQATKARVICRLNRLEAMGGFEIEEAIEAGADEILLSMVRTPLEAEKVLEKVKERCGVGILVETVEAANRVNEFAALPLSRVYVGLNDLAIERGTPHIFTALIDGTLERIREAFHVPFGFGGLTLPEHGHPIPCGLLMGEMARLRCDFSFLRRSFYRDIQGHDLSVEIPALLKGMRQKKSRSIAEVEKDREKLKRAVELSLNQTVKSRSLTHVSF